MTVVLVTRKGVVYALQPYQWKFRMGFSICFFRRATEGHSASSVTIGNPLLMKSESPAVKMESIVSDFNTLVQGSKVY